MTPDQFAEQNFTFVRPGNMTDEECGPLTVYKGPDPDGSATPVIISKWVDPATGTAVFVKVVGYQPPPIYIGLENPFEKNLATSEHKVGYIISSQQIVPGPVTLAWMRAICGGMRNFSSIYIANTPKDVTLNNAITEKQNFIKYFVGPWNLLFKDDQIIL